MKMKVTRRDVLKFGGGAVAGAMLTPAPWKLLDDLAIWTQNWSWIPRPPRGPVSVRTTPCALCPAGCGLAARCIGQYPVSLHDVNGAGLCSLGLTAHHLPYHPSRLATPVQVVHGRATRADFRGIIDATRTAIRRGNGSVAVLDTRPGRSVSWGWRRMLATMPGGTWIPSPACDGAGLSTLESMTGATPGTLGFDLTRSRSILSFGVPSGPIADDVHLVIADPGWSGAVDVADRWLPVRPGSEIPLAFGIAHVLLAEHLVPRPQATDADAYVSTADRYSPDVVARITGVPAEAIVAAARELAARAPALVTIGEGSRLGTAEEAAILGLNVILGSLHRAGGIVVRRELPVPFDETPLAPAAELDSVPNGSVAVLLIDASAGDPAMPWSRIQCKLSRNALVVALAPFAAGTAMHANFIVPTLPFLEGIHEAATPAGAAAATFAIAAPMLQPRRAAIDPVAVMRALAPVGESWGSSEELIKARAARIHAGGRGNVTSFSDGSTKAVAEFSTAGEFCDAIAAGARWQDDPLEQVAAKRCRLLVDGGMRELAPMRPGQMMVVARTSRDVSSTAVVSPAITKLYQESGLRRSADAAAINPATARVLGLRPGGSAHIATAAGTMEVTIGVDEAVMPGVIEIAAGPAGAALGSPAHKPAILDIWPADASGWRFTAARVSEG